MAEDTEQQETQEDEFVSVADHGVESHKDERYRHVAGVYEDAYSDSDLPSSLAAGEDENDPATEEAREAAAEDVEAREDADDEDEVTGDDV